MNQQRGIKITVLLQQLNIQEAMSAKSVIQNLEDSELIRIFLEFVQCYHLQYQKIDKEISYKCHEATWILATTKATGYGRTQSEAYKHALRNLLQILIEDPPYTQFFVSMLSSPGVDRTTNNNGSFPSQGRVSQNLNSKQKPIFSSSASKPPLYSNLSASLTSNPHSAANERELKTEEIEREEQHGDKDANKLNTSASIKYQSSSKLNSCNPSMYTGSYKCLGSDHSFGPEYRKQYNKTANASQGCENGHNQELKEALAKNKSLIEELVSINKQNQMLRAQLHRIGTESKNKSALNIGNETSTPSVSLASTSGAVGNEAPFNLGNLNANKGMRLSMGSSNHNTSSSCLQPSHTKAYSHANINLAPPYVNNSNGSALINNGNTIPHNTSSNTGSLHSNAMRDISNYKEFKTGELEECTSEENTKPKPVGAHNRSKVMVPKLKLEILPNYHKKAERSLNDSLLAVYEQKHGVTGASGDPTVPFLNVSVHNLKKVI